MTSVKDSQRERERERERERGSTKKACEVKEEEVRSQQGRSVKSPRKGCQVKKEWVWSQQRRGVKPTRRGCEVRVERERSKFGKMSCHQVDNGFPRCKGRGPRQPRRHLCLPVLWWCLVRTSTTGVPFFSACVKFSWHRDLELRFLISLWHLAIYDTTSANLPWRGSWQWCGWKRWVKMSSCA